MKFFKYMSYLVRHKYYVAIECFKHGLYWRAIFHDWSKFLPDEFFPYMNYFHGKYYEKDEEAFNAAWQRHLIRNPHHWQNWLLVEGVGKEPIPFQMSESAVVEMYCDWVGAGKAQGGNLTGWYRANRDNVILHPKSRERMHELMIEWGYDPYFKGGEG